MLGLAWQDAAPTDPPVPVVEGSVASDAPRVLVIDGLVGQIRGKPIFANELLASIGVDTLERLGSELSRNEFRREAQKQIDAKVAELLQNRLELTEAERSLSEQERMGLPGMRKIYRERLLAKYGGGSLAVANKNMLEKTQFNLDQYVDQYINLEIILMYRRKRIESRVHVDRREVVRYYEDHAEQFRPAPRVTVRVIVVKEAGEADAVDAALASGESFESVARRLGKLKASEGGKLGPFQLSGPLSSFDELSFPQLNEKVRALRPGERSDRVAMEGAFAYGWVYLDTLESGEHKSLRDAYLEIERQLQQEERDRLLREMVEELWREGDFTPPGEMADAVLLVAMNRYARAE